MIPVGNYPILWHIMKYYSLFGHREFILCLGHQGKAIKDFFLNYEINTTDFFTYAWQKDSIIIHNKIEEQNWTITFAETGEENNDRR